MAETNDSPEVDQVPQSMNPTCGIFVEELIRRQKETGSRELIPADDAVAQKLVYDALFAVTHHSKPD